jgi:hypothetical protein
MIQVAPFNSYETPRPWKWKGDYKTWPKFRKDSNPSIVNCKTNKVGCN